MWLRLLKLGLERSVDLSSAGSTQRFEHFVSSSLSAGIDRSK